jgi:hypothetical protein
MSTEETTEVAEEPAEAKVEKTKKDPVPEGWETPVAFAKRISAKIGSDFRPQMVYGFIKNSKNFPFKQNTDGHFIVEIEPALTWFDEKETRKAQRAADKAAKEAEKASATTAPAEA